MSGEETGESRSQSDEEGDGTGERISVDLVMFEENLKRKLFK